MTSRAVLVCAAALALASCGGTAPGRRAVPRTGCRPPYPVSSGTIPLTRAGRSIPTSGWWPATTSACRFAVVLFSHGSDGSPSDYSSLLSTWARAGFIVIGPTHPDRRTPRGAERAGRPADIRHLLDDLAAIARKLDPRLPGEIAAGRVGVAGHSFGGFTAADVAASDPRIRALIVMAGGADRATAARIHVPVLALAGARDDLIPAAIVRRFVAGLPRSTPRRFVLLPGVGHLVYTNACVARRTCAPVQAITTAFLRGRL